MEKIRWGIIGPGSIANNFADALKQSYSGELKAIASFNDERRKTFGDKYNIQQDLRFNNYDSLLNSDSIDAVYISTPHTLHAELSINAAGKGKHILCEKPSAVNFKQGEKVIQAVQEAGVFYKEGFMYRCHPQIPALLDLIKNEIIGDVKKITSSFGFDMAKIIPEHRLFNKDLAGGAILDVCKNEPLPKESVLWHTPNLTLTGHTAAVSRPNDIVGLFLENFHRFTEQESLNHLVDFDKGY